MATKAMADSTGERVILHCPATDKCGGSHTFEAPGAKEYRCPKCNTKAEWIGPHLSSKAGHDIASDPNASTPLEGEGGPPAAPAAARPAVVAAAPVTAGPGPEPVTPTVNTSGSMDLPDGPAPAPIPPQHQPQRVTNETTTRDRGRGR